MSNDTAVSEDDLAFERMLLGAGRAEALPLERTQSALLRFAAGVSALPAVAAGVGALGVPAAASAGASSRYFATGKWLALGAIAGSAATFVWLGWRLPARPGSAPTAALSAQLPGQLPPAAPLVRPAEVISRVGSAERAASPAERATGDSGGLIRTPRAAKSGSDLAAEVSALDGIRTALSIGAQRDAELRLASYRRQFARGALRSEADVLALELLVAQGRKQAAASAAERFIAQHPRDPQVARVRALVE